MNAAESGSLVWRRHDQTSIPSAKCSSDNRPHLKDWTQSGGRILSSCSGQHLSAAACCTWEFQDISARDRALRGAIDQIHWVLERCRTDHSCKVLFATQATAGLKARVIAYAENSADAIFSIDAFTRTSNGAKHFFLAVIRTIGSPNFEWQGLMVWIRDRCAPHTVQRTLEPPQPQGI